MNPWICPKCGAVFGPSAKECHYCNLEKMSAVTISYGVLSPQENAELYRKGIKGPRIEMGDKPWSDPTGECCPHNTGSTVTGIFLEDDDGTS